MQLRENYAQLQKEALAISWSIKKFYTYLYERKFIYVMNHQSFLAKNVIRKELQQQQQRACNVMQYFLQGHETENKSSKATAIAGGLPRLPCQKIEKKVSSRDI